MGKFVTFLLGTLIGLVVGGLLALYMFGPGRAGTVPGTPIQPPDPAGVPPGTAQIVLRQDFFNEVLKTIFRDMQAPAFPLAAAGEIPAERRGIVRYGLLQNECASQINLLPEGSGVQTALRFENDRIAAPLAFSGSYRSPFGCINFTGWAQANLELRFDAAQQAVFGQLNVETVNLDGVTPLLSGIITPIVQGTLNQRVNPIQMLQGQQIALNVPIAATNATMQARVRDVRAEVKDNALNLYVIYEFTGQPGA